MPRTRNSVALATRTTASWLAALLMICLAPTALAAVHKCVGADGKLVFSDHVCSPTQAGGPVKPAPTEQARKTGGSNTELRATCIKMRDRIANLLENGTGAMPLTEFRELIARAEAQCGDVAREEMRKSDAKEAAANAPLRQAQDRARCKIMRDELQNQQMEQEALSRQGASLTNAQLQQRAAFASTVKRECE